MMAVSKEIWMEISRYLPLTDKAAASRVNKAWNENFRPQMYRSLSLRRVDNNRDEDSRLDRGDDEGDREDDDEDEDEKNRRRALKVLMPPKEAVYEHGIFIQDLKLDFPSPFLDSTCALATPGLKRLRVDASQTAEETPEALAVLDQLLTSPRLKNIEMKGFKLAGAMYILQRVQHVETVGFVKCDFTGIKAFKKAKLDLRIKTLVLRMNDGIGFQDLINWIGQFHHLDTLELDHPSDPDSDDFTSILYPEKAPKINMSALRKVAGLKTLQVYGPLLRGKQLGKMLKNCPKVTNLALYGETLYDDGVEAMAELFPYLTDLNLTGCDRIRVWMVRMILDSCPRLLHLHFPEFDVEYMSDPTVYSETRSVGMPRSAAPWPCTGLRTLVLERVTWSSKPSHSKWFMKQIGSLKDLEVFQIQDVDREEEELRVVLPGSVRSARKDLKVTLEQGHFMRNDLQQKKSLDWVLDVWPKMMVFSIIP
ncbi:hypothetical protein EMPS_06510 [Entomortierella parvispora]|uniref:F-box domain-containing protein n=1 Tax=Entomortierella parvispora TaxID=205924 RepID=A0A9P3LXI6_9FUNG|nr:hypothetical protein EMPS_06510 [Entomortierella parvispora]